MGLISPILRNCGDGYTFWCPGCDEAHHADARWTFDGNVNAPTFAPSLHITWGHYVSGYENHPCRCKGNNPEDPGVFFDCGVCHSFVKAGKIEFLNDCTHHLRGQTVPIPQWPHETWHDG